MEAGKLGIVRNQFAENLVSWPRPRRWDSFGKTVARDHRGDLQIRPLRADVAVTLAVVNAVAWRTAERHSRESKKPSVIKAAVVRCLLEWNVAMLAFVKNLVAERVPLLVSFVLCRNLVAARDASFGTEIVRSGMLALAAIVNKRRHARIRVQIRVSVAFALRAARKPFAWVVTLVVCMRQILLGAADRETGASLAKTAKTARANDDGSDAIIADGQNTHTNRHEGMLHGMLACRLNVRCQNHHNCARGDVKCCHFERSVYSVLCRLRGGSSS